MAPNDGKLRCRSERCGYERKVNRQESDEGKVVVRKSGNVKGETLILDELVSTLPKTRIDCPTCGHNEATWYMRQTRAADEPTTRLYRCTSCSHTWREF